MARKKTGANSKVARQRGNLIRADFFRATTTATKKKQQIIASVNILFFMNNNEEFEIFYKIFRSLVKARKFYQLDGNM